MTLHPFACLDPRLATPKKGLAETMHGGVDAMVSTEDSSEILAELGRLRANSGKTATGEIVRTKKPVPLNEWFEGIDSHE